MANSSTAPTKTTAKKTAVKKTAAPKVTAGTNALKVTLLRSANNRGNKQEETLIGLGLKRIRQTKEMKDNPSIRGMLAKVAHLVQIEETK